MNTQENDLCNCRIIHDDRINTARNNELSDLEHQKLTNLYKAMGDSTRLKILLALSNEEMCVCDLAAFLGVTESAVSHQLRMLRQLYLVTSRRDGPILYYNLNDEHIDQLISIGLKHIRE